MFQQNKTKEFKYPHGYVPDMADEGSIDDRVNHEDGYMLEEWSAFAEDMLHRARTHGADMRFGDDENCLSYREIKNVSLAQYEGLPKPKPEYEAHLAECNVCDALVKASQEYFELTRPIEAPQPQNPLAVWYRKAAALLHRIQDYLKERQQTQRQ